MTLYQITKALESIAMTHPNIRTASDGSIYTIMNANPSVKYGAFVVTQTRHRTDEMFDHYGFVLFYIDRLVDDLETNRLQIQSIGKQLLSNIVHTFCDEYDIDLPTITFTPFQQKFLDETAGMYCEFELEVPKDILCSEEF